MYVMAYVKKGTRLKLQITTLKNHKGAAEGDRFDSSDFYEENQYTQVFTVIVHVEVKGIPAPLIKVLISCFMVRL